MNLPGRTLTLVMAVLLVAAIAWSMFGAGAPTTAAPALFDDRDVVAAPMTGDGGTDEAAPPLRRALDGAPASAAADRGNVRVAGRIVDRSTLPVRGADVRLALLQTPDRVGVADVLRVRTSQTTAADGRFAFTGPGFASCAVVVEASAAGHAAVAIEFPLAAEVTTLDVGDLRLPIGGSVVGQIVDARGRGLPGASVTLHAASRSTLALAAATTDAAGGYRFAHVAAGPYRVSARAAGRQQGRSPMIQVVDERETRVVSLQLAPGAELSGVVLGPGDAPIVGATVRAQGGRTTSGADGTFRIAHLPPTTLWVDVRAEGFVSWQRRDVDPARRLVVRLEVGLRITGRVLDAASRTPLRRYAARVRRLRTLESRHGTPGEQIARRLAELRALPVADAALIAELEARHRRVSREARAVARVPDDLGPVTEHEDGTFVFEGLDEGVYAVEVLAPGHQFAASDGLELRRGGPTGEVTLVLAPAFEVSGTTIAASAPVAGALVELVRVGTDEPETLIDGASGSAFAWMRTAAPPPGDPVSSTRSGADGRFELQHVAPGRYFVQARHPRHAVARSAVFDVARDRRDLRFELAATASLRGRVAGVPTARHGEVFVMVLGGVSTLRKVGVDDAGNYACDALEPGAYAVRAFLGATPDAFDEQIRAVLARDDTRSDVVLAPGDDRTLDLQLDAAALGRCSGNVVINGAPASGAAAELRSLDGVRRWSAVTDESGHFEISDVAPGEHLLRITVTTDGRQELHRAPVTVSAATPARVDVDLRTGSLHGRVLADDGTAAEALRGRVRMLPGLTAAPDDLRAYTRGHVVHSISVRNGAFRAPVVLAGPALLILELRDRAPTQTVVEVAPAGLCQVDLRAGVRR